MEGSCGEDDDPTALFEERCDHTVGSCHIDESEDESKHQVGNTEVDGEQNVFVEGRGGSVERNLGVAHVERVRNEGRERDVIVGPSVNSGQR